MLPCCGRYTPLITLSIELLPAPFGPMMARISCSRTSNEISVKAFTPPNASEIFCRSRITSPMSRAVVIALVMLCRLFDGAEYFYIENLQVGADLALPAVFELDLGFDVLHGLAGIERVD